MKYDGSNAWEAVSQLSPEAKAEVEKYPHHVWSPNEKIRRYRYSNEEMVCRGIFLKEIAFQIGEEMKTRGYNIRYRGRGQRKGKETNMNKDIRIEDAVFLSVYGYKELSDYRNKIEATKDRTMEENF